MYCNSWLQQLLKAAQVRGGFLYLCLFNSYLKSCRVTLHFCVPRILPVESSIKEMIAIAFKNTSWHQFVKNGFGNCQ